MAVETLLCSSCRGQQKEKRVNSMNLERHNSLFFLCTGENNNKRRTEEKEELFWRVFR